MKLSPAIALCLIGSAVNAHADWTVETVVDRLDATKNQVIASVPANVPLEQFGRQVSVHFVVFCRDGTTTDGSARSFKTLGGIFQFSETMAIGERPIRWRIDQHPQQYRKSRLYNDGKTYHVFSLDRDEMITQLRNAKTMKVEFDFPWAGNELREFDVAGGAAAFAKIPCR